MADTFDWRGRPVLVTGCTGFLGGAVARELLARGAAVVGLVHERPAADPRIKAVRGSADNVFRLHSAMAVHEIAAVFHLANTGPDAVLQAAGRYSRRVPVVCARPLNGLSLARTDDRLRAVRLGEVFGPGDRKLSRVVPAAAIGLLTGEGPALPPDGPPREFVFVRDAARVLIRAAEAPGEHTCDGWALTDRQMADAVRGAERSDGPLAEALRETLAWYADFLRAGSAVPVRAAA
jgi:nucleoside-diphosphate-sugar epimerase